MSKIPEGYTSITPYIIFDDASEAVELYKKAFNAEIIMSIPGPDGKLMHAEIQVGNARIMVGCPCTEYKGKSATTLGGSPVSFYVYVEDIQAAFDKAKNVGMAEKKGIEDMFWGDRMGTVTDKLGIDWTLAEHVRDVSPEEMEEAIKKMAC